MIDVHCKCGCGEVMEKHSYETERQWEKRKLSGLFRSKCKKNLSAAPVKQERTSSTLELVSANYDRPELVAQEKELPVRDLARLAFARSMPCCICGAIEGIQAHHEQEEGHGTMAGKTSDRRTIPLCPRCHMMRHDWGREWYAGLNMDLLIESVISQINEAYDNRAN